MCGFLSRSVADGAANVRASWRTPPRAGTRRRARSARRCRRRPTPSPGRRPRGPLSWPSAKAAVIAAIRRGAPAPARRRACCRPARVATMKVPPTQTAATSSSRSRAERRCEHADRHDDEARGPEPVRRHAREGGAPTSAVESAAAGTEGRPDPAEDGRVGDRLACHRGQEGRRNDVAEAEGAVAGDQPPFAQAEGRLRSRGGSPTGFRRRRAAVARRAVATAALMAPSAKPDVGRLAAGDACGQRRPRRPGRCRHRRRRRPRPDQPERPRSPSAVIAQADTPTRTYALAAPAANRRASQARVVGGGTHGQGRQRHCHQAEAGGGVRRRRPQAAGERADRVAEIVGAGEPRALVQGEAVVGLHQGETGA